MQYKGWEPERKGSGKCTGSREGKGGKRDLEMAGRGRDWEKFKQNSEIFCSQEREKRQHPKKLDENRD